MTPDKKILIIDDDARNIFALRLVLKAKGFACITSGDVAEAIKIMNEDPSAFVVLLDMMMPELDGYETLNIIRSSERIRNIPVIAVTAQAMPGDREKCIKAGATNYISKPVDVDALVSLLHKF